MREIAYLPLAGDIPVAFNSCRKGPRSLGWRDDKPAELYWAEAQVRSSPGLRRNTGMPTAIARARVVCELTSPCSAHCSSPVGSGAIWQADLLLHSLDTASAW